MMRKALLQIVLYAAVAAPDGVLAVDIEPAANVARVVSRFEGDISLAPRARAAAATVHATRKNWALSGRRDFSVLPEAGMIVAHLHSGRITTVIDGNEQKRVPGDYWVVPSGSQMSVKVTSEAASLETFSVR